MIDLHEKYAPILHFNKNEQFFPMRVDDLLTYSSLFQKGQTQPILTVGEVTPAKLAQIGVSGDFFVRTVESGPLLGAEVVAEWSAGGVEMVLHWAQERTGWTEAMSRKAYDWVKPKHQQVAQLFWWNPLLAPVINGQLETVPKDKLPRLTLPEKTYESAIDRYHTHRQLNPQPAYYYRYLKGSTYLYLQYWFFYGYNDWGRGYHGLNDHEGDWESMLFFFRLDAQGRPQEPPAYVTYATHESQMTKPWDDPDVKKTGAHVEAFVGAGSHATYPVPKEYPVSQLYGLIDYATGDGPTIAHDDWGHRLNLATLGWLGQYQGTWGTRFWLSTQQAQLALQLVLAASPVSGLIGLANPSREITLPGVSSPAGPLAANRSQNVNPLRWAGLA
jgi:hypothetical protein